jgi:hypothetical protein
MTAQNSSALSSEVCFLKHCLCAHHIHLFSWFLLNHDIHLYGNSGKRFFEFFVEKFDQALCSLIFPTATAR